MKKVAWITDDIYLKHNTGVGHPESIGRLESINLKIQPLKNRLIVTSPRFATKIMWIDIIFRIGFDMWGD